MAAHIVLTGNVIDGMEFYGPFADFRHALDFAEHLFSRDREWWVTELNNPNSEEDEGYDWSGLNLPPTAED